MNAGLRFLLVRTAWGKVRQLRRRFRGVKGALVIAGISLLALLVIGPQLFLAVRTQGRDPIVAAADDLRAFVPAALLVGTLFLGISKGALFFRPAEVQFLFPAPIARRELLVYNVVSRVRIQLLSALWCSIFLLPYSRVWISGFVAAFLVFAFLQLTSQAGGLAMAALGEHLSRRLRRILLVVLLVLLAGGFLLARASVQGVSAVAALRVLVSHPVFEVLSWLTRPFLEVFLADSVLDLVKWSVVACAILGAQLALMLVLDVAYMEGALAQAQRMQEAIRRMRSGGGAFAAMGPAKTRFRLPPFPALAGAGPIAWRHCQEMLRNLRGVLMMGFMMFIWLGVFLAMPLLGGKDDAHDEGAVSTALVASLFFTSMLTMNFPFDFRRDLDRMSYLKTLPLRPSALAAGQILPTTLLLLFWQIVALLVVAIVTGGIAPPLLLAIVVALPLLDWAVAAIDNATFLAFPYRVSTRDAGQMPFMGRLMLVMFLKTLLLLVVAGAAGLAAFLVHRFASPSWLAAGAAASAVLALSCIPLTIWVAAAFEGFDVATDIPD